MKPASIYLSGIFFVIITCIISQPGISQTLSERQLLRQYVVELKNNTGNDQLREKIIVLSRKIYPPVPTHKEYTIHLENAKKTVAVDQPGSSDFYNATVELNRAIEAAPWMPEAYFNIAMLYSQSAEIEHNSEDLQKAIGHYRYFLMANQDANKAKMVKEQIKEIQSEYDEIVKEKQKQSVIDQKQATIRSNWRTEYENALMEGIKPSSIFKGASLHIDFRLGVNFQSMQRVVNNNTGTYTTSKDFYGAGLYGGVEFWPLYGKYFGVGGFADGSYGISDNYTISSSKLNYCYGVNAFIGSRQVKVIGSYAKTTTNIAVSTFKEAGWDLPSSKVDIMSTRYGGGLRFDFKKKRRILDLIVLFEKLDDLPANQQLTPIFHLGYINSGRSFILFEVASNYPVAGKIKYGTDNNFKKENMYINLTLAHSFDFFGRRFPHQNW